MVNMNAALKAVVDSAMGQRRAILEGGGPEGARYAVIVGRRVASAADMLDGSGLVRQSSTLAGMRVIINEYTASVEVVREG